MGRYLAHRIILRTWLSLYQVLISCLCFARSADLPEHAFKVAMKELKVVMCPMYHLSKV